MLAVADPSAAEVVPLLRKIAADARSGEQGARPVEAWPAAGRVPADAISLPDAVSTP